MSNCIMSRAEMTDHEWSVYTSHLAKRAREEQEKIECQKQQLRTYRESLIADVLEQHSDRFTYDELKRMSTRALEMMW